MGIFRDQGMLGGRVRLKHDVYFVRHGQTDWNAERRFQGHADIPLNDTGRAQAARNGDALTRDVADVGRFLFIASPLMRATQTLEIMREAMGVPARRYAIDDRLIEVDLGDWNGKTYEEIEAQDPGVFTRRETNKWEFTVPGGESYADAAARTREFLVELKAPAVIVGHGAAGRILRGYLLGLKCNKVAHLKAPQDVVFKISRGRELVL